MQLGALATGRSGSGAQMQVGVALWLQRGAAAAGRCFSGMGMLRDGVAAVHGCRWLLPQLSCPQLHPSLYRGAQREGRRD